MSAWLGCPFSFNSEGRGGEGRGGEGRGGEGREGKGREGKGREGKGREGKGREGKGISSSFNCCSKQQFFLHMLSTQTNKQP